jgi:hypothetical protein
MPKLTVTNYDESADQFTVSTKATHSIPSNVGGNVVGVIDAGLLAELVHEWDEPGKFVGRTFQV